MHDVDYFAAHFVKPAFVYPDAEFPVCNGEKAVLAVSWSAPCRKTV